MTGSMPLDPFKADVLELLSPLELLDLLDGITGSMTTWAGAQQDAYLAVLAERTGRVADELRNLFDVSEDDE